MKALAIAAEEAQALAAWFDTTTDDALGYLAEKWLLTSDEVSILRNYLNPEVPTPLELISSREGDE